MHHQLIKKNRLWQMTILFALIGISIVICFAIISGANSTIKDTNAQSPAPAWTWMSEVLRGPVRITLTRIDNHAFAANGVSGDRAHFSSDEVTVTESLAKDFANSLAVNLTNHNESLRECTFNPGVLVRIADESGAPLGEALVCFNCGEIELSTKKNSIHYFGAMDPKLYDAALAAAAVAFPTDSAIKSYSRVRVH
jgi:hypothetical protein